MKDFSMYKKIKKYSISCKMCPKRKQTRAKKVIMKLITSFHYCWKRLKVPTFESFENFLLITCATKMLWWDVVPKTIEVEHVSCFPSSPKTTPFLVLTYETPTLFHYSRAFSSFSFSFFSCAREKRLAPFSSSPKRATPIHFMFSPMSTTHSFSTQSQAFSSSSFYLLPLCIFLFSVCSQTLSSLGIIHNYNLRCIHTWC